MKKATRGINLINLYLDPTLVSEEEAKILLKEEGYDIEELERKRLNALDIIAKNKIRILAEKNKSILNEVIEENLGESTSRKAENFNLAASDGSDNQEIGKDAELLKKLNEKKGEKDKREKD